MSSTACVEHRLVPQTASTSRMILQTRVSTRAWLGVVHDGIQRHRSSRVRAPAARTDTCVRLRDARKGGPTRVKSRAAEGLCFSVFVSEYVVGI